MRYRTLASNRLLHAALLVVWALLSAGCGSEPETWEEGQYVDGRKHGAWTRYRADGTKIAHEEYDHGLETGVWRTWYPDGAVESETTYERGAADGPHTEWHPNGVKRWQGQFRNGKREGTWYQWDDQGNLIRQQEYKAGTLEESYPGGKPNTELVIRVKFRKIEEAGLDAELVLDDLKNLTLHHDYTYKEEDNQVTIVARDSLAADKVLDQGFTNLEGSYHSVRDLAEVEPLKQTPPSAKPSPK